MTENSKNIKHRWVFCSHCDRYTVICGNCNNNSCNGGVGEINGKPCTYCEEAYKMSLQPHIANARDVGTAYYNAKYVGRPSDFGNPFSIASVGSRAEAIRRFEAMVERKPEYKEYIKKELKGKNLVCWCFPLPCHASVLLRIANSED